MAKRAYTLNVVTTWLDLMIDDIESYKNSAHDDAAKIQLVNRIRANADGINEVPAWFNGWEDVLDLFKQMERTVRGNQRIGFLTPP